MSTRVEVITLPYDHLTQRVDDSALEALQATREVIAQESYLVGPLGSQSLVLVLTVRDWDSNQGSNQGSKPRHTVTYVPASDSGDQRAKGSPKRSSRRAREAELEATLAALSEGELHAYESLRSWRNAEGIRVGVPPFEVCSNLVLVECVTRKPHTLTALRAIKGLGERRVKRFGEALLSQLRALGLIAQPKPEPEP